MLTAVLSSVVLSCTLTVIDGDTLRCGGEKIRLINIDAPETTYRAECAYEKMLGKFAALEVERMLKDAETVTILRDQRKDRYGRALARIELDGKDLGARLIQANLAQPWTGKKAQWCD